MSAYYEVIFGSGFYDSYRYEAKEEKETVLIEDHLTEIGFEKERRGL